MKNLFKNSLLILLALFVFMGCDPVVDDDTNFESFEVGFETGDGSVVGLQNIKKGEKLIKPENPTKVGYVFEGWFKDDYYQIEWIFEKDVVEEALTLYAKWKGIEYTITFYINSDNATGIMVGQIIACGDSAILNFNQFVHFDNNYVFAGWATSAAGQVKYADKHLYTMGIGNVDLYAIWSDPFEISFHKNNIQASGDMENQTVGAYGLARVNKNKFELKDYRFIGWALSPDGEVVYQDEGVCEIAYANIDLYAKWALNVFNITFLKNNENATGSMDKQAITFKDTKNLNKNVFKLVGHSFVGWSTSPEGSIKYLDQAYFTMGEEDVILYVQWSLDSYNVIFHKNNISAVGNMSTQTIEYETSANLKANTFNLAGYSFVGWATSSDGEKIYDDEDIIAINNEEDINLYAVWGKHRKITFDKNNPEATGSMPYQYIGSGTSEKLRKNAYSLDNYPFVGWSTTENGNVKYLNTDLFTAGDEDITLFARWGYKISFNKNHLNATGEMDYQVFKTRQTINLISNTYILDAHIFAGWSTSPTGSIEYNDNSIYSSGDSDITLYAKWAMIDNIIKFDKNFSKADGIMSSQEIIHNATFNLIANTYNCEGYSFAGWATSPEGNIEYNDKANYSSENGSIILYAKWTPNLYAIKFNKNNFQSKGSMNNQIVACDEKIKLAKNNYTLDEHIFIGWGISASGNVEYLDEDYYIMGSNDANLYAKWKANDYEITFDKNNANCTGNMSNQIVGYNKTINLNENMYVLDGCSFIGWSTSPNGEVEYLNKAFYTMSNKNITLYAKWKKNNYTITFDKNNLVPISGTMLLQYIEYGAEAKLFKNNFEYLGWTFIGWSTSPNGDVVYLDEANYIMGNDNVVLYARWSTNTYTISFDKNSSQAYGSMPVQKINSRERKKLIYNEFILEGYSFAGWATSPNGNIEYFDNGDYRMSTMQDETLYAIWTKNKKISFSKNNINAEGEMTSQVIGEGLNQNIKLNTFILADYTFVGWATSPHGKVEYINGFEYTMGNSDVILYAIWTKDVIESQNIGNLRIIPSGKCLLYNSTKTIPKPFYMSEHLVTREQFVNIMKVDPSKTEYSSSLNDPVQMVNWYQAIVFCNKLSIKEGLTPVYSLNGEILNKQFSEIPITENTLWNETVCNWNASGYRLAKREEWLWAAMGADKDSQPGAMQEGVNITGYNKPFAGYNGNNSIEDYVWYNLNSESKTHPVGTKLPNELGIFDMSGNVWEWGWIFYGNSSYWYSVWKGGSAFLNEDYSALKNRIENYKVDFGHRYSSCFSRGFRVVRNID